MTSAVAADRQDSAAVGRAARVGARLTDWWDRLRHHVLTAHPAAWLTAAGIFIFGVVFAKGTDNLNSVAKLRQVDAAAQSAFDSKTAAWATI